jgi:UDP-glucose 6-dehydrogenase
MSKFPVRKTKKSKKNIKKVKKMEINLMEKALEEIVKSLHKNGYAIARINGYRYRIEEFENDIIAIPLAGHIVSFSGFQTVLDTINRIKDKMQETKSEKP